MLMKEMFFSRHGDLPLDLYLLNHPLTELVGLESNEDSVFKPADRRLLIHVNELHFYFFVFLDFLGTLRH